MSVLEKVLEEIENHAIEFESFGMCDDYVSIGWVKEIIRSRICDIPDANTSNKRLIDADVLDEEVRNFFLAITGNPKQATVVRECKESFRKMIDEQPTVYEVNDWIPVDSDDRPKDEERVLVSFENFNVVLTARYKAEEEGGTFLLDADDTDESFVSHDLYVSAWQPLPNPYKGE